MIDEPEGEVADEGDLTIPDAVLFNDSLDEGVDPTALLVDADLPIECAAAESKPGSLSQTELNDSLSAEDLDETQLPASDGNLTQATVETEATTCVELKTVTPPQADGNKKQSKFSPKTSSPLVEKKAKAASLEGKVVASCVESQPSKGVAKMKPLFGKKKKGFTPPKVTTKAATTTSQSEKKQLTPDQSSSNAAGKAPPQSSSPETGPDSLKQQPQSNTDSDVKTTSGKVPSIDAKTVKVADKKMIVEEKQREKEKKEQERALKKQASEQKKLEREKKKAEFERQRNEKRLELERRKAEREQKKMEKELKKMEREQKKAEKQAKASQKKQQAKDKKPKDTSNSEASDEFEPISEKVMEDRSHDTEKKSIVDEGANKKAESNVEEKENIPPNEEQSSEMSTKDVTATLSPIANCGDESKTQKVNFSSLKKGDDQQNTSEHEELAKDTTAAASPVSKPNGKEKAPKTFSTPKEGGDQQKISDSGVREKEKNPSKDAGSNEYREELNKNTATAASPVANMSTTEVSRDGTTKQKEKKVKKFSPPKAKDANEDGKEVKKQRKAVIKMNRFGNFSGAGDDVNKKTQGGEGKKRKPSVYSDSEDELEPKRAKPDDNLGSVWVQCENTNCKKWRLLRDCDDPAKVPGKWVCSMNTDPEHNSCSAEEERWCDLGDSLEFVESPFIPGSLVWSKMDGYPW